MTVEDFIEELQSLPGANALRPLSFDVVLRHDNRHDRHVTCFEILGASVDRDHVIIRIIGYVE